MTGYLFRFGGRSMGAMGSLALPGALGVTGDDKVCANYRYNYSDQQRQEQVSNT